MIRYLADRFWQSLLVLAVMSFVIYGLIGLMPGDPIDLMISADPRLSSEDAARLKAVYGLDRPLLDRYVAWLGSALAGDLGYSRLQARPVLAALAPALGNTARLMTLSLVLSLAIALPAGIIAAYRRHSWIDHGVSVAAFVGISTPPFWTALVLIVIFAVLLGILPAGGSGAGGASGWFEDARFLVLPVASLTLASVGGYLRYVRASMIETLSRDWIRTARAKGLSERRVIVGHALRPALIPVATILGVDFGALFSGALVTETVFAYPGMGQLIYDAVLGNDYNLALAALLLATALTLTGNLLADLAYALLDPRISLTGAGAMNSDRRSEPATPLALAARRFHRHPLAIVALAVLGALAASAVAAPSMANMLGIDVDAVDLIDRFAPPSSEHPLGTDELGRDVLWRLLAGGRASLLVGVTAAIASALIGTLVGLVAGYFGGRVDAVLMRVADGLMALPLLPLLIVLAAIDPAKLGVPPGVAASPAAGLLRIVCIVSLVGWTTVARLVRAETLQLREETFVLAARAQGAGAWRMIAVHILPNLASTIIVATTLAAGNIILLESVLSFLGLGIQPPTPSWGNLLTNAQELVWSAPALAIWPGLLILVTVVALNVAGDGLREALDPRAASG